MLKQVIAVLGICFLCSFHQSTGSLPSIDLKTLSGKSVYATTISNDGAPIILCVWEVSCRPCIQEFDNISRKYAEWQKETGVKVVAISIDDNKNYHRVNPLVKSKGWAFEFYQDKNQDIKRGLGISFCPFTLVINGKGDIVWRKGGYTPGDEDIAYGIVQKLLKGEKIED